MSKLPKTGSWLRNPVTGEPLATALDGSLVRQLAELATDRVPLSRCPALVATDIAPIEGVELTLRNVSTD
jgi:hypothetical protein